MARLITVIMAVTLLVACAHQAVPPWGESPEFNDCWNIFPPGPDFDKQIEEYMGTTDRNVTVLGCQPLYHLNEAACSRFQKVGAGAWPDDVVAWCEKYFGVVLLTK